MHFWKKSRDQVDEIIDQLNLSKCIPNVSFKFISCQEICKKYVVMSNCNLRMRRCFKFLKHRSQNLSIETWIRVAKFN